MKKSLLLLTAALTFGSMASAQTNAAASAPQVPAMTDVPAGHWAKDAIDRLTSKGILLGYPDGTFRGTQNLTRYEAAVIIARLLDQINAGTVPAPQGEDLTALQNAVQELAADLAALGVRVSDLEANAVSKDDFSRLEARVEALSAANGDADAVAKIQAQIDDLTARADDYDTLRADVDDNASSIAALNDLTVLLNQDILDLQDRVSAVEAAQADFVQRSDFDNLSGKVTAIDTRVTKLENAPKFSVSGTISAVYGNIAVTDGISTKAAWLATGQGIVNFDVDRLTRQTFADGAFSTGNSCKTSLSNGLSNGFYSFSGNPVSCPDTGYGTYGQDGGVSFGIKASNLTTANGQIVVNSAAINFGTTNAYAPVDATGKAQPLGVTLGDANANGTIGGQKFDVTYHATRSNFKFNDYLFANDNANEGSTTPTYRRGIVANIEATQLPFKPKLTIVAGTAAANPSLRNFSGSYATIKDGTPINIPGSGAVPGFTGNYYGVRASINPMDAGTFGVAFAQNDGNRSALGADWDLGFGAKNAAGDAMFKVNGVAVASLKQSYDTAVIGTATNAAQNAWNNADKAFYTEGRVNLDMVKFGAQYHAIGGAFANGVAGMSVNDAPYFGGDACGAAGLKSSMPYCPNEKGYGAAAATNIGPVALDAYYDSVTNYAGTDPRTNSFGIAAGLKFRGLKAVGFYNRSRTGTDGITYVTSNGIGADYMGVAHVPFIGSSSYGAVLSHDGKADDALVKNLNFTVADAYVYDIKVNDFQIYGNYEGTFGGVTLAPFARYHMVATPSNAKISAVNGSGDPVDVTSFNTFKYGVKASTQPFTTVPLQPSAFVNFAQRNTTVTGNSNVASETFVQAGVSFNRFLADNLKTSIGYAYYKGSNVGRVDIGQSGSATSATFSPAADRIYANPNTSGGNIFSGDNIGANSGKLDGVFAQADWNGLQVNYGVFRYYNQTPSVVDAVKTATGGATDANNTPMSFAQAFKVSYTFKF